MSTKESIKATIAAQLNHKAIETLVETLADATLQLEAANTELAEIKAQLAKYNPAPAPSTAGYAPAH